MKNANMGRLGGFTLIELLVVVLIIGILAAMAMPQYFKAVERSRMTEAVTLMDSIAKAQRRKFLQTNHYAERFEGLDVSPKGATGSFYYTEGDPRTGRGGNGFKIYLPSSFSDSYSGFRNGYMHVERVINGDAWNSSLQYQYKMFQRYQGDNIDCQGINQAGRELCADFCGIDTPVFVCCNNGTSDWCPW